MSVKASPIVAQENKTLATRKSGIGSSAGKGNLIGSFSNPLGFDNNQDEYLYEPENHPAVLEN